jgi:hypothetical protein
MPGLIDQSGGNDRPKSGSPEKASRTWEASMLDRLDRLRQDLLQKDPHNIATFCDATFEQNQIYLSYWGERISIQWPDLEISNSQRESVSTFDMAMIIYYLHTADGTPMADRWIGFRELPNGAFYNQAFQGYSGNRLAKAFGQNPAKFNEAAQALDGWKIPALAITHMRFNPSRVFDWPRPSGPGMRISPQKHPSCLTLPQVTTWSRMALRFLVRD